MSAESRIYLDHNATSPVRPEVSEAMRRCEMDGYGNPSSIHAEGRAAKKAIEKAADFLGELIGCDGSEILFTSGGTESNNLAILGAFDSETQGGLVSSEVEHDSVLGPARRLAQRRVAVTLIGVDEHGALDEEALEKAFETPLRLVSIMTANNETGAVYPIKEIAERCRQRELLFHTDAAQAVGRMEVDLSVLKADLLSLSAHKLEGPKGVGALYVRKGVTLLPQILGGPQQRGVRGGTLNVAGIVGLGEAARLAKLERTDEAQRQRGLLEEAWRLLNLQLDGIVLNGPQPSQPGLSNTMNMHFQGVAGDALHVGLDLEGVAISAGAACDAGASEPSRVLTAMGLDLDAARASIRVSVGRKTTREEIQEFVKRAVMVVKRIRAL